MAGMKVFSQKTFWNFLYIYPPLKRFLTILKAWSLETSFDHTRKRHASLTFVTGDWGVWLKIYQLPWLNYFEISSLYTLQQWGPDMSPWRTTTTSYFLFSERLTCSSPISGLFENQYSVWRISNLSSIIEVDRLLATWKTLDRLLLRMWAEFLRWARIFGCLKGLKEVATIFVQNRTYVGNTKEKQSLLIWNWDFKIINY